MSAKTFLVPFLTFEESFTDSEQNLFVLESTGMVSVSLGSKAFDSIKIVLSDVWGIFIDLILKNIFSFS